MQPQISPKLHSTAHKQKIFNVRKRPFKCFDNEKYLKLNCSPVAKKQIFENIQNLHHKKMEYHYQLAIMTSPKYKQLAKKYKELKQKNKEQKELKLSVGFDSIQMLRQKQNQLKKYKSERQKLIQERQKLNQKRYQIKSYINEMRQQRQIYHLQHIQTNQIYQTITADQLKNTIMALHYQGGVDIDTDNMTYEQLLQLQEKIGKVSKGINERQYLKLQIIQAEKKHEEEVCSICYENIKEKQKVHKLRCKHMYHCECIKQWFTNEKTCPMCKQEVFESEKN